MRAFLLPALLLSSLIACKHSNPAPDVPFTMNLQVLSEQGVETTGFAAGQNQVFRLTLTNTSDKSLVFTAPLFDASTFLSIEGTSRAGSATYSSFGKPYQRVFCDFVNAYTVPAHQSITLNIGWLDSPAVTTSPSFCGHTVTSALPVGHYRTAFTPTLTWNYSQQDATTSTLPALSQEFDVR